MTKGAGSSYIEIERERETEITLTPNPHMIRFCPHFVRANHGHHTRFYIDS